MGFAAIAELTHEMEDVFELLRQRAGGLGTGGDRRPCSPVSTRCQDAVESIETERQREPRPRSR